MANPFSDKAKSSSKSKFKALTGKSGGGQKFDGEPQAKKPAKKAAGGGIEAIPGKASGGRLDKFARGGRTKKGATNVNIAIVVPGGKGEEAPAPMMPPPGPPVGPPPGGPPMMPPGMPGMKRGGRLGMTAGAESGVGRLEKIKAYKKQ